MTSDLAMFLGYDSKAQATKGKIYKWEYVKLKNICSSNDITNRVKGNQRMAENITNQMADKGLVSRLYKEPLQLKNKKSNNLI